MTRETALGALLCELFSADTLRRFLRFDPRGASISSQLPAAPTPAGEVHLCAVALLSDAGMVDRELFTRIANEFPARREEIRHVAARWIDADGKQQRLPVAPSPVAAPPPAAPIGGAGPLELFTVLSPSAGPAPGRVRFEIRANKNCIVYQCGVSAAKVIRRDAAWNIGTYPDARFRHDAGPVAASAAIAVITDASAATVLSLIIERASQLVDLASNGAEVLAGEPIAMLDASLHAMERSFRVDTRGSDFGGVLRWQPALTDPVWLGTLSVPREMAVIASDCDEKTGLHVVRAPARGVILHLAPNLIPGDRIKRDQVLCWQQLEDRRIALTSPINARAEEVHISAGANVARDEPVITLRHAPARPKVRVEIATHGSSRLYLIHAPLPGIFLETLRPNAAAIPSPGQIVEREKPLCTILAPGSVPCDIFTDVYGRVTRVIAPPGGRVRRGQPLVEVRVDHFYFVSPCVGTYYKAPKPGEPPFVHVGKRVLRGDVLCIVEHLKVMHNFESPVDGVVERVLVEEGDPIEYGQLLILIQVGDYR